MRMDQQPARANQAVFEAAGAVIASLMVTCLSISVTLFGRKLAPGWQAGALPVLTFLVSLERMFTYKRLKRLAVFSRPWVIFHTTQWVVLLLGLKLLLIAQTGASLWMQIQLWRLDFPTYFLDNNYILAVLFIGAIWLLSGYFAGLLDEMSLEESLIRFEMATAAPLDKPPARERLLTAFFGLGFFLVILTAFLRVDLRMLVLANFEQVNWQPLPYLAAGAWNVLLYFLLGLALMSLSQLARLNAGWHFQKLDISTQLAGRWVLYSLVFIGLVALVASLLPTNYSLGFLAVLRYVLQWIFGAFLFVFGVLLSLLVAVGSFLAQLFGFKVEESDSPATQPFAPPELPPEISTAAGPPWLELLKSLLFWLVFAGVVGFSLYQFVRQHEELLARLRQMPGASWLAKIWAWLRGGWRGLNRGVRSVVQAGMERLRARQQKQWAGGAGRFINPRRLSPRQRVYFFFLAMIRRGGERGLARKDSQTPYEYAAALEEALPEVDQEVASLTEAFVAARYARSEVDENQAGLVRRSWDRIRGALRSLRK